MELLLDIAVGITSAGAINAQKQIEFIQKSGMIKMVERLTHARTRSLVVK